MSAIGSIWSSNGSVKLRSSQVIKILLNSMIQSVHELRVLNQDLTGYILGITKAFREMFQPNKNLNFNDQLSGLLSILGWKNTELSITSASTAKLVLGNNRYIDEGKYEVDDILLVVNAIIAGACYHLFDKEVRVDTKLDNLTGVTYDIKIEVGSFVAPSVTGREYGVSNTERSIAKEHEGRKVSVEDHGDEGLLLEEVFSGIDADQIFEPIFKDDINKEQLYAIFKEVLLEYAKSKYELSLDLSAVTSLREQVLLLLHTLIEEITSKNEEFLTVGHEVGMFFAQGVRDLLGLSSDELFVEEVLESADFGVVRDIHARCFCLLRPGEKCKRDNLQYCDFIMGVWESLFLVLLDKTLKFSSRIPATSEKDLYCLMEFTRS